MEDDLDDWIKLEIELANGQPAPTPAAATSAPKKNPGTK
jgi:hypothetical protein